jgi:hypothetical protein
VSVLSRLDRHARLVDDMADTVGVDLAELMMRGQLAPNDYRSAIYRCTACTNPTGCADWVAAHPDGAAHAPGYCRNRTQFDLLAGV